MAGGILAGFLNTLEPLNLLMLFTAVVLGFFGGAMPGVSGMMLIIVLIPITYGMPPIPAFLLITAIYLASCFSGAISAILYRIPGTPEAVITSFDGYPMGQKGQAGEAMGIAMTSSAIGGMFGALFLMFLTPPLANFALKFSSPEYFALALMGLTVVASLSANNLLKGLLAALLGLFLATIGIDSISSVPRFTFHVTDLMLGLNLVPMMIGLFGIPEVLKNCQGDIQLRMQLQKTQTKAKFFVGGILRKCFPTIARSSLIGAFVGILPGVGGTTAALLSYSQAVRSSKHPEEFGTGIPEGIAAPEAANNCAGATAFVPLISLGIPGSATTAVILGIMVIHGLKPGPMFISSDPELAYTIFAGLFMVNILMMIFAKPFISLFVHTQRIPYGLFAPMIIIFCFIGTYAVRNSMFDIWVMVFFSLLGYFFDKIKFPLAPIILGIVLGPMAEEEMRRSLVMSSGDYSIFFTRPISLILLMAAMVSVLAPIYKRYRQKASVRC